MSETNVEWTWTVTPDGRIVKGYSYNRWIGCTPVSPGCLNCYASAQDKFRHWTAEGWGAGKPRRHTSENYNLQPLLWNKKALTQNIRPKVFAFSLADWADMEVVQEWRDELFDLIEMTPNLDWLLVTKRAQEASGRALPARLRNPDGSPRFDAIPRNIWWIFSAENQFYFDSRWPFMKAFAEAGRIVGVSAEPLLGSLALPDDFLAFGRQAWVIAGGESGGNARPMHPAWPRGLRDQCLSANVPFFFKQWGQWVPTLPTDSKPPGQVKSHEWNGGLCSWRVGKSKAGRLLDGVVYNDCPGLLEVP